MFFQSCGTVVQAKRMDEARQALIPAQSLSKPGQIPTLAPQRMANQQPQPAQQPPTQPLFLQRFADQLTIKRQQEEAEKAAQAQREYFLQMQRAGHVPGPMPGYQQMMPVNYHMPSYLSIQEPHQPGGFWKMFTRTVFRSMGKAVGHSIANMFDTIPLSTPTKPPGDPNGT